MKETVSGVPLAQFAAVTAALAEAFSLRAVLALEDIEARAWAEADIGWSERLHQDRELRARYEADVAAAEARLRAGGKARLTRWDPSFEPASFRAPTDAAPTFLTARPTYVAPPVPIPASDDDATSAQAGAFASPAPVLPFAPGPSPLASQAPAPFAPSAPGGPRPARASPQTLVAMEIPSVPMPFPAREPARRRAPDTSTMAAFELPSKEALPFQSTDPGRARLTAMPAPRPRATETPSNPLSLGALPFQSSGAPPPPPVDAGAPARPSVAPPANAGETADPVSSPASFTPPKPAADDKALPRPLGGSPSVISFGAPPPIGEGLAHAAAPQPTRAPAHEPSLSLERHAHMCLEMALDPSRTAEVLARYNLTPEERARVDAHYRAQIASDPELGARWHQAYTVYHGWFASRSRT